MIKTRFISMLVLLMTAVTGATAQTEELLTTITMSGDGIIAYSVSGRATLSTSGLVETGMVAPEVYGWSNSSPSEIGSVTITAAEGYEITKVVFWNYQFMVGYNGDITDTASPFTCYLKGSMRSLNEDMSSGSSGNIGKIEVYGYAAAPAASTYTVTLKESTEDATSWTITPPEATTTGVAAGTEVKATYGGAKKVKSVKAKKKASAAVPVTAITLNKSETTITKVNDSSTETLSVTAVTPDEATDKTYTWSSDATDVATVDENGIVTAVAEGTAHIRATANDGSGVYGECTVTVSDLSAYYSNMVECGCDNLFGICYSSTEFTFTGQVLSAAQAIALAQAKAAETGSNCAVFYDNGDGTAEVRFAKNDGTTGSGRANRDANNKGLSGYKGYYVSK